MGFSACRPIALSLLLATAAGGVSAHAEDGRHPREAVITVSGNGEAHAAPDTAVITLAVTKQEKTARESLDANNKAMTSVLDALNADGIEPRDLQTSGFSIQPVYNYPQNSDGSQSPPELVGYQTTNSLTIRLRDLAKAGAVIDKSVTLGINQGGDIRFINDDTKPILATARGEAVKDAMEKAKQLADAAGIGLGRILEINESMSSPLPVPMEMARMAKADAPASVPMAPGENTYNVSVNVTFEIKP
jgi:uncharacterized protein YggE